MELIARMQAHGNAEAIATSTGAVGNDRLLERVRQWQQALQTHGIAAGDVVSVEGDYRLDSVAALLACIAARAIVVPLSSDSLAQRDRFLDIARVRHRLLCADDAALADGAQCIETVSGDAPAEALYARLREDGAPGLVLFTSGSTGANKAAVHDLTRTLAKFQRPQRALRTLVFLQLDHIGGINTLFYALYNGGCVVVPASRSARDVCTAIARHRVELLPTSPTFLNLLLMSGETARHDLSSLQLITYGTEPMPASTLQRLHAAFPGVTLKQTYGSTEVGILRSVSRGPTSLWVKVGGEDYDLRVKDGRLWVRSRAAMLGYLNAPAPFDAEGFMDTGDLVEVDGDWVRILGRLSESVNVGGHKVHPAEVESVLLEIPGVIDAIVTGEANPLTGQILSATLRTAEPMSARDAKLAVRRFCSTRLPRHAIPARVVTTQEPLHSARFKRMRQSGRE